MVEELQDDAECVKKAKAIIVKNLQNQLLAILRSKFWFPPRDHREAAERQVSLSELVRVWQ